MTSESGRADQRSESVDRAASKPKVRPLGVLSRFETGDRFRRRRDELLALSGTIDEADRPRLAAYLRGGTIIFAAMEWTWDVIGDAFNEGGGSGLRSDGAYYWRSDAASYVEHYGIALPAEFIEHARGLDWQAIPLTRDRMLEVDHELMTDRQDPEDSSSRITLLGDSADR